MLQNVVDKLLKKANVSLVVGTSSWREQFSDAITVSAGWSLSEDFSSFLSIAYGYLSIVGDTTVFLLFLFNNRKERCEILYGA